jgi:hypothetical protein
VPTPVELDELDRRIRPVEVVVDLPRHGSGDSGDLFGSDPERSKIAAREQLVGTLSSNVVEESHRERSSPGRIFSEVFLAPVDPWECRGPAGGLLAPVRRSDVNELAPVGESPEKSNRS